MESFIGGVSFECGRVLRKRTVLGVYSDAIGVQLRFSDKPCCLDDLRWALREVYPRDHVGAGDPQQVGFGVMSDAG